MALKYYILVTILVHVIIIPKQYMFDSYHQSPSVGTYINACKLTFHMLPPNLRVNMPLMFPIKGKVYIIKGNHIVNNK